MSVLHVLLPSPPPGGAAALRRWLARGDRLSDVPGGRDAVVRRLFRFPGEALPVAALRHHGQAGDAARGSWLCADPAYVRGEPTGARLMACPIPDLSGDEAQALAVALGPLFEDAGFALAADSPSAWCLHAGEGLAGVAFPRPADALGADLLASLPAGEAGRRWRQLFSEAQIALHAHPVNAARIAAGKVPVNALWFWGAGSLPAAVETGLTVVATTDDVVRGLAKLAGVGIAEPSPEALESTVGDGLLDLGAVMSSEESSRWLPFFEQALGRRRFDSVELVFPAGERFRVRHAHRLRFWRRG
jgi:hypothetical protein